MDRRYISCAFEGGNCYSTVYRIPMWRQFSLGVWCYSTVYEYIVYHVEAVLTRRLVLFYCI